MARLSKPKLKSKIKYWVSCLTETTSPSYKDLDYVIDRAVNCRNYFVHGGEPDFDYFQNFDMFTFLTRALEFCYVAPEFIKGGWNLGGWRSQTGMFHPFGNFTYQYQQNVEKLKALVAEEKAARRER
ncbi:HEPN domain-containing protein [Rhizobium sp. BK591]|uniref:HEPN domain-containing protein n=1 Tax=Rhizobium sp. BK591 TaxID=2586985 RepID=UPI001FEE86E1|nr:HEPN domain-containing protein [Rhizobium sp. BK591]